MHVHTTQTLSGTCAHTTQTPSDTCAHTTKHPVVHVHVHAHTILTPSGTCLLYSGKVLRKKIVMDFEAAKLFTHKT